EDVRARLAVLSEIPAEWATTLHRWTERNARHRARPEAPSLTDELMLYETLVGAWPERLTEHFETRIARWQLKAIHEAKLETSWTDPDPRYEEAAQAFLSAILRDHAFTREVAALVNRIGPAGAINSMAQTLLKLTVPGVPDFYQGTEFWDLSLVDPDNRRPVDFVARERSLDPDVLPPALAGTWRDGRVKQAFIAAALRLRATHPELFDYGEYLPLAVEGAMASHVIAFARQHKDAGAVIVAPRLPFALLGDTASTLIPPTRWSDTTVTLPPVLARPARNVMTGEHVMLLQRVPAADLLSRFPIAALVSETT
ncbi:MAG: malto-oligosyltrehalose synthase, partial [Acetobacteraceae bacterium]|nr:malto-oligosyltrehalose synthase [Acetobacteraceae bacterium]